MLRLAILIVLSSLSGVYGQCPVTGSDICNCNSLPTTAIKNPELNIVFPWEGGPFFGYFVVETKNISYRPDLATNPANAFNVGIDNQGVPLLPNEGHIHGWLFRVNRAGDIIRNDSQPTPRAYLRFYGAGGAEFYGDANQGWYVKEDDLKDLPRGRYRIYFQAQHHDHTALTQANAPAFPPIASRDFIKW